jgi:hypothetical protein
MKKSILVFSMAAMLLAGGLKVVVAQEQPKPKKDTVNIDTDAKPTFYYAEDEKNASKSKTGLIVIIAGAVIVAGAAAYFLLKKKK